MSARLPLRVLVSDDDEDDFVITRDVIAELGVPVDLAWHQTYHAGMNALLADPGIDVCLLDFRLGAKTGVDLLTEISNRGCLTPIILLTGSPYQNVDFDAMKAGAADYLVKGELTAPQLERSMRYARGRASHLEATRRAENELRDVIEKIPSSIVILRGESLIYANPATADVLGYDTPRDLIGRDVYRLTHPDDRAIVGEIVTGCSTAKRCELRLFKADGDTLLVETPGAPTPITFGGKAALLLAFRDLTDQKQAEALLREHAEALHSLSLIDDLTQLYNRRGFLALGAQQLKTAVRHHQPAVVLFIDLDGLKTINDELGHLAGDAAIQATGTVLRTTFRDADVIARLGGDEFVALIAECGDPGKPIARLHADVEGYNAATVQPFRLALSTGAAAFDPHHPESLATLMQRADAAMYAQKRARGGTARARPPTPA